MTARRSRLQGKNLYGLQRSFRAPKEIRMRVAYRRDNFKFRNHSFYRSRGLRTCGFFMEVLRTVMPRGASRNLTKDEITSRPDLQLWSACNFDALELAPELCGRGAPRLGVTPAGGREGPAGPENVPVSNNTSSCPHECQRGRVVSFLACETAVTVHGLAGMH